MRKGYVLVSWAITDDCNMNCRHCYNDRSKVTNSIQEVQYIIEQIIEFGGYWNIYGINILGGEPFVFPDILQIVKEFANNGLNIGLSSNGMFFVEEENCLKFKNSLKGYNNYLIQISLESIIRERYEYFRGGKNSYRKLLIALNNLKKHSINYGIRMTVSKDNINEMENICKFSIQNGASYISYNKIFLQGSALNNSIEEFDISDYKRFINSIYQMQEKYGCEIDVSTEEPSVKMKGIKAFDQERNGRPKGGCSAGVGSIYIAANGDILPCRSINHILGNLGNNSLKNIWENRMGDSLLYKLRDRNNIKGRCGKCFYRDYCGGCRSGAYIKNNDVLDEAPFCLVNKIV